MLFLQLLTGFLVLLVIFVHQSTVYEYARRKGYEGIKPGLIGLIPIYAIHRHRGFWRNPETFDPERFASDAPEKPNRYQYLPFGAGPRICIGAAFSIMESKIMLANFVRAAEFKVEPGFVAQPTGQMFLTAGGAIPMQVKLRH